MNGVIFHDLSRPLAELYRPLIIHLEANGNNHLKIIVILAATDLTFSLGLNCQVFLDSCLRCKLAIRIDPIDVLRNRLLHTSLPYHRKKWHLQGDSTIKVLSSLRIPLLFLSDFHFFICLNTALPLPGSRHPGSTGSVSLLLLPDERQR